MAKIDEAAINHNMILVIRDIMADSDWIGSNREGMDLVRIESLGEVQGVLKLGEQLKELLHT